MAMSPLGRRAILGQLLAHILLVLSASVSAADDPLRPDWVVKGKNSHGYFEVVNPVDNSILVQIPAGRSMVGREKAVVDLPAFHIGKYEITWKQYGLFCTKTGRSPVERLPGVGDDHPVVNVSYDDAAAYCTWANMGLPSGAQWERAARGSDGLTYPWGDTFDWTKCNSGSWWLKKEFLKYDRVWVEEWEKFHKPQGRRTLTSAVGAFDGDVSPFGLMDVAGNVEEFTEDLLKDEFATWRLTRGGCWRIPGSFCTLAQARGYELAGRNDTLGFRPCTK